jgi:16S rRNA (guanine527-N7)-methyltransferase
LIVEAAGVLACEVSHGPLERLGRYAELVSLWNARVNLTGARAPRALVDVLFADALVLSDEALVPAGARVIDVGAGGGAPAIPLAILRPDLHVTLLEPRRLRVAFLRTAIGTLDLGERAEVDARKLQGPPIAGAPFDVALSRATFEPAEWLPRGLELAPRVVVLSGAEALPSDPRAERAAEREYRLPFGGSPRQAGVYLRRGA